MTDLRRACVVAPVVVRTRHRLLPLWILAYQLLTLNPLLFVTLLLVGPPPVGQQLACFVGLNLWAAVCSLALWWAARRRGDARLTPFGIRPRYPTRRSFLRVLFDPFTFGLGTRSGEIDWLDVWEVEVSRNGKWFEVETANGYEFLLPFPHRTTDPAGYVDAVERFAGPDHPLAVALRQRWGPNEPAV